MPAPKQEYDPNMPSFLRKAPEKKPEAPKQPINLEGLANMDPSSFNLGGNY